MNRNMNDAVIERTLTVCMMNAAMILMFFIGAVIDSPYVGQMGILLLLDIAAIFWIVSGPGSRFLEDREVDYNTSFYVVEEDDENWHEQKAVVEDPTAEKNHLLELLFSPSYTE